MAEKIEHTANLEILNDYDASDYDDFVDSLAAWATQYVPEVAFPIAQYAEELFKVAAVRLLLDKWHKAQRAHREHQIEVFKDIATNSATGMTPEYFESWHENELRSYNTALYALIVQ